MWIYLLLSSVQSSRLAILSQAIHFEKAFVMLSALPPELPLDDLRPTGQTPAATDPWNFDMLPPALTVWIPSDQATPQMP